MARVMKLVGVGAGCQMQSGDDKNFVMDDAVPVVRSSRRGGRQSVNMANIHTGTADAEPTGTTSSYSSTVDDKAEEAAALLAVAMLEAPGHGLIRPRPPNAVSLLHYRSTGNHHHKGGYSPTRNRRSGVPITGSVDPNDAVAHAVAFGEVTAETTRASIRILRHNRAVESGLDDALVVQGVLLQHSPLRSDFAAPPVDDASSSSAASRGNVWGETNGGDRESWRASTKNAGGGGRDVPWATECGCGPQPSMYSWADVLPSPP